MNKSGIYKCADLEFPILANVPSLLTGAIFWHK